MSRPRTPRQPRSAESPAALPPARPPAAVRVAGALVALQGVAVVVLTIVYAVFAVRDRSVGVSAGFATVFGLAAATLLVTVLARNLARGSRRAFAPAILLELICLGEAYNMTKEHRTAAGASVAAVALGTIVALVIGIARTPDTPAAPDSPPQPHE
jgi:hypothetical protein